MHRGARLLPAAALVAAALAAAGTVQPLPALGAQLPCVLDKCMGGTPGSGGEPTPEPPITDAPSRQGRMPGLGGAAPGGFDFYVLALSWSPGFCATGGDRKAPDQCASGRRLGFVVHGLWPQNTHGFPSDCGPAGRVPSRQALDTVRGLYPDEGFARHEWRMHGTCTGRSPTDYFADVRRAREGVAIPAPLQAPQEDQRWAPSGVARAFAAANPGLRTDAMAVTCREGLMEEVRICLAKDLRSYVPCPEVARGACRNGAMVVPGLR